MTQPFGGGHEFLGQPEIDEITGDGDVVGLLLDQIVGEDVEDVAAMHEFPPAMPIHIAQHALAEEVAAAGARHRAQMNIGEMREGEQTQPSLAGRWAGL